MKTTFQNVEEKLKRRTLVDPTTGCWLFQGAKDYGYGITTISYVKVRVHRVSACLYLGLNMTDETTTVNHKPECPNKHCWNPEHLYVGSSWENVRDSIRAGTHVSPNKYKTHCPRGHEYTEENTYIRPDTGRRKCRECDKLDSRERL